MEAPIGSSRRHERPLSLTGTTLLEGLQEPGNEDVWEAFVRRYRPLLVATLRKAGVAEEDAEDVAQVTLLEFARAYRGGQYRRERGRLRAWLFGILRNQLRGWQRREGGRRPALRQSAAELLLEGQQGDDALGHLWEQEWRQGVLRAVLEQVRAEVAPERWRAFELFVLEERGAAQAAELLGTTPAFVYASKRRVLERVRALRPLMNDLF